MYRKRFGLRHHPLPRNVCGPSFYDGGDDYARLARVFAWLASEPGLGLLTGEAGVGKTAAIRNLCDALPKPEHRIVYICDTAISPASVYRNLAAELGEIPRYRRADLWRQLKKTIAHLVDAEGIIPILVLDEAQHLGDDFFCDLAGFLNYAFDTRDLLTVWLIGLPTLATRLAMRQHAALATRIVSPNVLGPRDRQAFTAMIEHGLRVAGATSKILSDQAHEILWRTSHGIPRMASKLLRAAMSLAHERDQTFVDDQAMLDACDELRLTRPTEPGPHPDALPSKSRRKPGTTSRV